MLRNDLINFMTEHDNDNVAVDLNGTVVDLAAVTKQDGGIILRLDPEGLAHALDRAAKNHHRTTMRGSGHEERT